MDNRGEKVHELHVELGMVCITFWEQCRVL